MLLMALYNLGAGGVTVSNVLVGMLVFAGGIAQALVAMWELARGNTLFATCKSGPSDSLRPPTEMNDRFLDVFDVLDQLRRCTDSRIRCHGGVRGGARADPQGSRTLPLRLVHHYYFPNVSLRIKYSSLAPN